MENSSSIDSAFGQQHNNGASSAGCIHELVAILRDYRPHVFRFLLASFGDPELARDLTQHCVETAFWRWSRGYDESLSRKSMMRLAVNLERRHWLKKRFCFWRKEAVKTTGIIHLNDWLPNNQQSIADRIGTREQIKRVWEAVCRLSNRQRIVFLLHCVEEMTSREIAEVADIHEWTVHALLAEVISRIRATIYEAANSP